MVELFKNEISAGFFCLAIFNSSLVALKISVTACVKLVFLNDKVSLYVFRQKKHMKDCSISIWPVHYIFNSILF